MDRLRFGVVNGMNLQVDVSAKQYSCSRKLQDIPVDRTHLAAR